MKGPFSDADSACKEFKKKFKDKTKNNWDERADFKLAAGKYMLLEMDAQDETDNVEMEEKVSFITSTKKSYLFIYFPLLLAASFSMCL